MSHQPATREGAAFEARSTGAPDELINITEKEMSSFTVFQAQYPYNVYLAFCFWRKMLLLVRVKAYRPINFGVGPSTEVPQHPQKDAEWFGLAGDLNSLSRLIPPIFLQERRPLTMAALAALNFAPTHLGQFLIKIVANAQQDVLSLLLDNLQLDLEDQWEGLYWSGRHDYSCTLLMVGARHGIAPMVALLLHRGADPGTIDENGVVALHLATSVDVAKLLVDTGKCDIEKRGNFGETPLLSSVLHCSVDVVRYLLSAGADPTASDQMGSVLHVAPLGPDAPRVVELLLSLQNIKMDVNAVGDGGATPLHYACDPETARLLVNSGATVEAQSHHGKTPLLRACLGKNGESVVRFLVEDGKADPKAQDDRGLTALDMAVHMGRVGTVRYLLEQCHLSATGPRPNGSTLLHNIGPMSSDEEAADLVRLLVDHGVPIDHLDESGRSPLHVAVSDERRRLQSQLPLTKALHLVANANLLEVTRRSNSMLHLAARAGHADIVTYLLENGCPVNATDIEGRTPLHNAVQSTKFDEFVRRYPLDKESPCYQMMERQKPRVVGALIEFGASLDVKFNGKYM